MNTSRVNPLDEGRTELLYNYYFADLATRPRGRGPTVEGASAVVREDFGICEITHQNYATGGYRPGPLSPRHEAASPGSNRSWPPSWSEHPPANARQ